MSAILVGSLALVIVPPSTASALPQPSGDATATVETSPVAHAGDAADDPAIWRNPLDPAASLVIGNDKGGALEVYDLTGSLVQRFDGGFFGNVDTRSGVATGVGPTDIAVTYRLGVRIFGIDAASGQLSNITDSPTGSIASPIGGEGMCLYVSPSTGQLFVFVDAIDGRVAQFRLTDGDADGLIEGTVVRQWDVGGEVEGCVADDELGYLYISEEDEAIWKYGAEPSAPTTVDARTAVDRTVGAGGRILPDAEGLTIVYLPDGEGYLIASSQAASDTLNSYLVYERAANNAFIRSFRVVDGPQTDGCGRTDGIDALAADLGPAFPEGIFICQDNTNTSPGSSGNQNFKFVPLDRVVGLPDGDPPPPPGDVLMVVADPNALIAGETAVRNRLTNAGYQVTVIDDGVVGAANANGTAFVFISSTVNAATVGTKLRDVVQPVWTAKPFLFDDMRMTGPVADVDYGSVSSASIVITAPAHPLAAGLSGTVGVTTANHGKSFGVPGAGAETVATAAGRVTTFVYQAGDTLVGGTTAPGCRLTSSAMTNGPASFTAAGWALFDAAADYAAGGCQAGPPPPDGDPSVDLTSPTQGATVGGTVNVTATASDAEGITQVAFAVDGTSIGVDTNGTNGWSVPWNTTTHAAGPATVSATATDTASKTASDQVAVTVDNASPGTVLMVVGDPNALIAGETAVRNRLTNAGYTVTVVDDGAVTAAQANGTAFVFISSNVNATTVGTKLRDVVQPVWTAKPYLFDDMRMTGTGAEVDYGNVSSASIVITAPAHPLAAGLSGTVAVTTANHTKSFGIPGAGADTVATAAGKVTTFVYQAGDTLVGGTTAPGCRLASSVMGNAPTTFTAAGWTLFDAAAAYAAGGCQ